MAPYTESRQKERTGLLLDPSQQGRGGERVAVEQTFVGITDRPQPDGAHVGVRVGDVVAVPSAHLGLVIEAHFPAVERILGAVLVADTETSGHLNLPLEARRSADGAEKGVHRT